MLNAFGNKKLTRREQREQRKKERILREEEYQKREREISAESTTVHVGSAVVSHMIDIAHDCLLRAANTASTFDPYLEKKLDNIVEQINELR